jgi:hypothetical protein
VDESYTGKTPVHQAGLQDAMQVYTGLSPKKPLKAKFKRLSDENGFFWLRVAGAGVVV